MATYTVTNTFSANTTAVASQVNQNFTDVLTALNAFDAANLTTGTLSVSRIANLTSVQMATTFFLDEDDMASDSATAVASQQSIKAYVGDQIDATVGSGTMSPLSYVGGESVTFPNGLVIKFGRVAGGSATITVTFGSAFPNSCIMVMACEGDNDLPNRYGNVNCHTLTTTSLKIYSYSGANVDYYNWIAIGR